MVKHCQVVDAAAEVEQEPNNDNWGKCAGDFRCPERLNCKKKNEDRASDSDNCRWEILA